ncbi:AI-2E family transporter [Aeromicrobium alkaliterrae]|uniref:AI-2E family transporter n=1 Tax=Aeromicrobium alkaliterrae TaxID=302168 RepID=A0ABP4VZN8_9ACTN
MSERSASERPVRDRAVVIDRGFAVLQKWALRAVLIAAALFVIGWVVGRTWMIWFPVALALVLATVLAPPVTWLRRHKIPDGLAAAGVMIAFIGLISTIIAILAPQVAGQAPDIADKAVGGLTEVRDWLRDGPFEVTDGQITNAISAVQEQIRSSASTISAGVFSTIGVATNVVLNIVVTLILTFLFIKDGHRFLPWIGSLAGRRAGTHAVEVLGRSWETLGGFIRTQTLVSFIDAVIIGAGLAIVGVPLWVPLAVVTFFGGFIPIVGAFVSGALAVLVTLVTNSPKDALIVLLIVFAVQQLEGNVLSPWLQGKTMNLHAAVVLLSVLAGGSLFGITGAFLAVPTVATVATVLRYLNEQIDDNVDIAAPPEDSTAALPHQHEHPDDVDEAVARTGDA